MEHDLAGLLENPNVILTEPSIKCYLRQLLHGINYLHQVGCSFTHHLNQTPVLTIYHQNKILHRDMKGVVSPFPSSNLLSN